MNKKPSLDARQSRTQGTAIIIADAEALHCSALTANGVGKGTAPSVAKALVAAEAEGQAGRGVSRVADYVAQVRSGKLRVEAGCVGLMVANAPAAIAPWGSKNAVLGSNPIAFAAPRQDGAP